jgi:hypothetical protein
MKHLKADEDLPPPELKHLPPDLKYRFLEEKIDIILL